MPGSESSLSPCCGKVCVAVAAGATAELAYEAVCKAMTRQRHRNVVILRLRTGEVGPYHYRQAKDSTNPQQEGTAAGITEAGSNARLALLTSVNGTLGS